MAYQYDPQKVNQPRFNANAAYDLSSFQVEHSEPAQEEKWQYKKPELKLAAQPVQKTSAQWRNEERLARQASYKIVVVAVILFAMLAAVLYGESAKNQLTREIAKAQTQLNIAESENTRLNMQLNSLVTIDKIEQYATETLGMVKLSKHQIEYVDTSIVMKQKEKDEAAATKEEAKNTQQSDEGTHPSNTTQEVAQE